MNKIALTQGYEARVDEEDYDRINDFKWRALKAVFPSGKHYVRAVRSAPSNEVVYMSYEVLQIKRVPGLEIDHIDGIPLNNTKINLRVVTKMVNMQSRRGFGPRKWKHAAQNRHRR